MLRQVMRGLPASVRGWFEVLLGIIVALGLAVSITNFVLQSYVVSGRSMEPTLHEGDIVLANKFAHAARNLIGQPYTPKRGALVVFKNPFFNQGDPNAFIVKRVIGLPGDHILVHEGRIIVYPTPNINPGFFNPDEGIDGPQGPTSGNVDRIVPENEIFVVGDNRQGNNSLDSRNGMSTVPINEIEGTVLLRFWPLDKTRLF